MKLDTWSSRTAAAVYREAWEPESMVFDVMAAADVIKIAGDKLLQDYAKSLLINPEESLGAILCD